MLTLCVFAVLLATSETETSETSTIDHSALVEPTLLRHKSEAGQTRLSGVQGVLDEQLSGLDRRRLGRKVLSASRVQIATGSFPDGGTAVVTVNVPLTTTDPEDAPRFISGVFTLDDAGHLASIIVAPRMQTSRYEIDAIGNVDGDAHDDIALYVGESETTTRQLVRWTDGAPSLTALAEPEDGGC